MISVFKMGLRRRFLKWRTRKRGEKNHAHNLQPQKPNVPFNSNANPDPSYNQQTKKGQRRKFPPKSIPVKALYDFVATQPDECSFLFGDLLMVLDNSGDWWKAINCRTKEEGLIPGNYVTCDMSLSNVLGAWYNVDRMGAERKLLMPGVEFGTYILRPCDRKHFSFMVYRGIELFIKIAKFNLMMARF